MRFNVSGASFEPHIERNLDPSDFEELVQKHLKRPLQDFERDARYIAKHRDELTAKYPDEWVAIIESEVVAHSGNNQELMRQLEKMGLRQQSVIRFLSSAPVDLIL